MATLNRRWALAETPPPGVLANSAGLPPLLVQLMYNRGLQDRRDVEVYLGAGCQPASPFLLAGMDTAVARLRLAIRRGESIAVYGDFDLDGVSATVLLVEALRSLGARVEPYIPDRFEEGYGLNGPALKQLATRGIQLVVTVDCGTRSHAEVEYGNRLGLEMIITDHHRIRDGEGLPPALCVINPQRKDCHYPFKDLSGVSVALKLADALFRVNHRVPLPHVSPPPGTEGFLDLAALGTIGDVIPLTGENRTLVRRGLAQLRNSARSGIRALVRTSGTRPSDLDAATVGYRLGPRLNAAGRLEKADLAYELMATDSEQRANELAQRLEELNRKRQSLTASVLEHARDQVSVAAQDAVLIARGDAYHAGVVGLVSSRLRDEFYRPAVVINVGETHSRGSARSIPDFDITGAFDLCSDLLVRHGGHAMAAGFTVNTDALDALETRLREVAREKIAVEQVDLTPTLHIDAELHPRDITYATLDLLDLLRPFGVANEEPCFLSRDLSVRNVRVIHDKHVRLALTDGTVVWSAIAFNQAEKAPAVRSSLDVAYHLQRNVWNGEETLQLQIVDLRTSST